MIDNARNGFLDSQSFVRRASGAVRLAGIASCAVLAGCSSPRSSSAPQRDLTSGRIVVVCPPEARSVIGAAAREFERLYPTAHIELRDGTSREAIAGLFGARADGAVVTRELLTEERRAAVQGRLNVEGYRFARDAAVLIVNENNPLENLAIDDVRRIFGDEVRDGRDIGGRPGPIVPVVQAPGTDVTEFFIEEVMGGNPIRARSQQAVSDSDVVARVAAEPGAIGYVTLGGAKGDGIRRLRIAGLKGLPYYLPDAESVHRGTYPMTRFYSLYVRPDGPPLANGFVTFLTSFDGQKLVREAGLVPTAVPVRIVRSSPMVGTHPQGDSTNTP